jgi:uncharacterized membrane protein
MAQNKVFRFGPVALTNTLTTNLLNPNITSLAGPVGFTATQQYIVLKHIRILNKTAGAVTFSLWIDGTGGNTAGKEFIGTALSVAANSAFDWYGAVRLDAADFLVGGASANTSLTINGEGEIGVSG